MIANNSGSSHHTEKDLWLQVLALAKEIQDCKSYLYPKTLESIYDNIVRIEKLLDILLIITRGSDKLTLLFRLMRQFVQCSKNVASLNYR